MNRRTLVACLVAVVTVLDCSSFALAATGGPAAQAASAPTAADLNAKITAARKTRDEAQSLTLDAVRGKAIDTSQPVAEGEKPKLKDLTDDERNKNFQEADKKFDDAAKIVADVLALLKKSPNVIADPTSLKMQIDVAHASALVKNVNFLKQHKIGSTPSWLTLAQKAVGLDKTNSDAQQLVTELKAQLAAEKKAPPTTTKSK